MAREGGEKMIVGMKGVKYGLQAPKASSRAEGKHAGKRLSVFSGGGSSSDEEDVAAQVAAQQAKKLKDAKIAAAHAAALAEDSNVYEYDGVYDQIHQAKKQPKMLEKQQRKPKYIAALVETAAVRKKEQDVAFDRRTIKERKKEDHLFGDKEVFVTSSYKKKLQEDAVWMEEQKRKEEMEAKVDVTKRKDLSDFYRNFYTSNSGIETEPQTTESHPKAVTQDANQNTNNPSPLGESHEDQLDENSVKPGQEEALSTYEQLRLKAEQTGLRTSGKVATSDTLDGEGGLQNASDLEVKSNDKECEESEKIDGKPLAHKGSEDRVAAAKARYLARKRKIGSD